MMSASASHTKGNVAGHFDAVTGFYDRHPINETQIMDALAARGISPDAVTEAHLSEFDQDHYGGIPALEALADDAGIRAGQHVLDVCSGMGGPARYLAFKRGCRVTGIDLTASRVASATRLTALAHLEQLVDFSHGNALQMPLADGLFDVVIAQEAWAHIPNKAQLVREVVRVLKPGGVACFTDILRAGELDATTSARLAGGMTFTEIESVAGYRTHFEGHDCKVERCTDLGEEWTRVLQARHAMYRSMRDSTVAKFGEEGYRRYDDAYAFFVGLYEKRVLTGARFVIRKPA
jgi:sarcosine/dimethylglycine N-methyltransferase